MLIQVQSVTPTKSGKGYMVNGKYFAKLNIGIEQKVGQQIEALLGSFQANGQTIETIDAAYAPQPPQERPQAVDRWWLPFVSNQCAHAIQAGLIVSGDDLIKWAAFAKHALMAMESSSAPMMERKPLEVGIPGQPDATIPF